MLPSNPRLLKRNHPADAGMISTRAEEGGRCAPTSQRVEARKRTASGTDHIRSLNLQSKQNRFVEHSQARCVSIHWRAECSNRDDSLQSDCDNSSMEAVMKAMTSVGTFTTIMCALLA